MEITQRFSKKVSNLFKGSNMTRKNQFGLNFLSNKMAIKLNVFCVFMEHQTALNIKWHCVSNFFTIRIVFKPSILQISWNPRLVVWY